MLDGAYWAAGWAFDRFFGPVLGPQLLDQATEVEELRAGAWVPVTV